MYIYNSTKLLTPAKKSEMKFWKRKLYRKKLLNFYMHVYTHVITTILTNKVGNAMVKEKSKTVATSQVSLTRSET